MSISKYLALLILGPALNSSLAFLVLGICHDPSIKIFPSFEWAFIASGMEISDIKRDVEEDEPLDVAMDLYVNAFVARSKEAL